TCWPHVPCGHRTSSPPTRATKQAKLAVAALFVPDLSAAIFKVPPSALSHTQRRGRDLLPRVRKRVYHPGSTLVNIRRYGSPTWARWGPQSVDRQTVAGFVRTTLARVRVNPARYEKPPPHVRHLPCVRASCKPDKAGSG